MIIFGGGIAGLWALDSVIRAGYSAVLLEKESLGKGQTICAQGIIHGGFKYVVPGKYRAGTASEVRHMPQRWRQHLLGERKDPDLSLVGMRSPTCYFWLSSGRGFRGVLEEVFSPVGLNLLNSPPIDITHKAPEWLKKSATKVYEVPEPVVDSGAVLGALGKLHANKIFYYDSVSFERDGELVREVIIHDKRDEIYTFVPSRIILTAGIGNQELVDAMEFQKKVMQIRPLRQLIVRGNALPDFWGHCINGGKAVATVTTHYDSVTREKVWSIGGEVAEDGYKQDPQELIRNGRALLEKVLRGVDFSQTKWGTFDALRAEEPNDNVLPSGISMRKLSNVWVCFPTKMAMAPVLADYIVQQLKEEALQKTVCPIKSGTSVRVAGYPWDSVVS